MVDLHSCATEVDRDHLSHTCQFGVEDLLILLTDFLFVVFEEALTQVAHLPQGECGLVLLQ